MSEHTGGTVTYHRAEYRPGTDEPWLVWFTEDQADPYWFTAEQGEAMGLTPPEPAPLVVTCNGHSIELSDEEAEWYSTDWEGTVDRSPHGSCATKLAGLLRDARQDPQPASEVPEPDYDPSPFAGPLRRPHRPLRDADGSGAFFNQAHPDFETQTWDARPEQDDTPDIDFDALPIGTVLRGKRTDSRYCVVKTNTSAWTWASDDVGDPVWTAPIEWRIVYQPPVLSPRQCLEALLAGRDDADELIEWLASYAPSTRDTPSGQWNRVLSDAARGGV